MRHFMLTTALTLAAAPLTAEQAILVLDGSGSMWGQIDGRAKITIAQEVVGELLNTLPVSQELGLTVYGHRRKGDCSDIETLVAPGGARDDIRSAVNAIKPKGKTPMTDAVVAAAKALRYTEEKATVILVSDGIETCAPDPCAAARALEEAGVDFTAHVVGFDVSEEEALKQMQCLASETGGSFRKASDADELGKALEEVVQVEPEPMPEPDPAPEVQLTGPTDVSAGQRVTYTIDGEGDATDFLGIFDSSGEMLSYKTRTNGDAITLEMPQEAGQYELRVLSQGRKDAITARLPVTVSELIPALDAPATAAAGSTITVTWTGPGTEWDFLTIAAPDAGGGYSTASDYLTAGNPIEITAPDTPGTYELRYIYGEQRQILVHRPIIVE